MTEQSVKPQGTLRKAGSSKKGPQARFVKLTLQDFGKSPEFYEQNPRCRDAADRIINNFIMYGPNMPAAVQATIRSRVKDDDLFYDPRKMKVNSHRMSRNLEKHPALDGWECLWLLKGLFPLQSKTMETLTAAVHESRGGEPPRMSWTEGRVTPTSLPVPESSRTKKPTAEEEVITSKKKLAEVTKKMANAADAQSSMGSAIGKDNHESSNAVATPSIEPGRIERAEPLFKPVASVKTKYLAFRNPFIDSSSESGGSEKEGHFAALIEAQLSESQAPANTRRANEDDETMYHGHDLDEDEENNIALSLHRDNHSDVDSPTPSRSPELSTAHHMSSPGSPRLRKISQTSSTNSVRVRSVEDAETDVVGRAPIKRRRLSYSGTETFPSSFLATSAIVMGVEGGSGEKPSSHASADLPASSDLPPTSNATAGVTEAPPPLQPTPNSPRLTSAVVHEATGKSVGEPHSYQLAPGPPGPALVIKPDSVSRTLSPAAIAPAVFQMNVPHSSEDAKSGMINSITFFFEEMQQIKRRYETESSLMLEKINTLASLIEKIEKRVEKYENNITTALGKVPEKGNTTRSDVDFLYTDSITKKKDYDALEETVVEAQGQLATLYRGLKQQGIWNDEMERQVDDHYWLLGGHIPTREK